MSLYLKRYAFPEQQISVEINPETDIIIVIPCYKEKELMKMLMKNALINRSGQIQPEITLSLNKVL